MADTLSLYKLIILKMLEQVEYPLTNSQITEFFWTKNTPIISPFSRHSPRWMRPVL